MKIECTKDKLHKALQKLEKVTVKNPTLPVLKCILFDVSEKNITLKATNLDIGVETEVAGKVHNKGSFAVPGDVVTHLFSNIDEKGKVVLEKGDEDNFVTIRTQKTSTKLNTYPADDFPNIPQADGEKGVFNIPTSSLEEGVRSVWFSASTSNIKPELSSIYVYEKENKLYFVATDFFRLSEKKIDINSDIEGISVLLPYKNTQNIIKIINEYSDVSISIDENQISFTTKDSLVTSRTINGNFPDYQQIIPKEFKTKATLLKEDLVSALKINSIFSGEFNQVKFIISSSGKDLTIETSNSHIGTNTTNIDAKIEGEDIEITFNHKYISDCLPYFNSESVILGFEGLNKPLTIKGVNDDSLTQLIMPMNK
ncbi:MAG: DNA polymerase III subunit beta [Candidatus Paceibacterota bacterium]